MFADELIAMRKKYGLTQSALAAELQVTTVHDWETGSHLPNAYNIRQLHMFCMKNNMDDTKLMEAYHKEKLEADRRRMEKRRERQKKAELSETSEKSVNPSQVSPAQDSPVIREEQEKITGEEERMISRAFPQIDDETRKRRYDDIRWMNHYTRVHNELLKTGKVPRDPWVRRQLKMPQSEERRCLLDLIGIRLISGSKIEELRKGITRSELAEQLVISEATLAHWESTRVPAYQVREIRNVIREMKKEWKKQEVFFVHNGVEYTGIGNGRTLLVHTGTQVCPDVTETFRHSRNAELREKLIQKGIIQNNVLTEDYEFASPAKAASVLSGCAVSNRDRWHDREGRDWYEIWPCEAPVSVQQ